MILDPQHLLSGVEWSTREAFERLASAFQRATHMHLKVRSGARSCAYQNSLYAQGRTTAGPIVTDAQGCNSWHVVGRAIDADPANADGTISSIPSDYETAGALWKKLGGVWGGDFTGLDDIGHFEFHPGIKIGDICPVPTACREGNIDTVGPAFWPWIALGVVVSAGAAWALLPDPGSR